MKPFLPITPCRTRAAYMTIEMFIVVMFIAVAVAVMAWEWHAAGPPRCSPIKMLHKRQ